LSEEIKKDRFAEIDEKFSAFFFPAREREINEERKDHMFYLHSRRENVEENTIEKFLNQVPLDKIMNQFDQIVHSVNQIKPYVKKLPTLLEMINKIKQ